MVVRHFENQLPSSPPVEFVYGLNNPASRRNLHDPTRNHKNGKPESLDWDFKDILAFILIAFVIAFFVFLLLVALASLDSRIHQLERRENVTKMQFEVLQHKDRRILKQIADVRAEMDAKLARFQEMMRREQQAAFDLANKNSIPEENVKPMSKSSTGWFKDSFYNGVYVGAAVVGILGILLAKAYGWKNNQHVAHMLEHQNAKIVLANNSKNCWDISPSDGLTVRGNTVTCNGPEKYSVEKCSSVRVKQGFPTVLDDNNNKNAQLGYTINYAEFKIDYDCAKRPKRLILFLACEKFSINKLFGINYGSTHYEWEFDQEDDTLGGNAADGMDATKLFGKGDTIGCGVLLIHRSATAKWAKCALCEQPRAWVFFTKNGCILDDPQPLPVDGPSHLYPTIVFRGHLEQEKVTANFGQKPFLFAIPPAIGLFAEPSGQNCEEQPKKPVF